MSHLITSTTIAQGDVIDRGVNHRPQTVVSVERRIENQWGYVTTAVCQLDDGEEIVLYSGVILHRIGQAAA